VDNTKLTQKPRTVGYQNSDACVHVLLPGRKSRVEGKEKVNRLERVRWRSTTISEKCTEGRGTHEVLFGTSALAIRNLQISRCLRDKPQLPIAPLSLAESRQATYLLVAVAAGLFFPGAAALRKKTCGGRVRTAARGAPGTRPRNAVIPGTRSAEMRCNSRLPQIPQCAYKNVRNGIRRA